MTKKINVKGTEITIVKKNEQDFISLTDMVSNQADGSKLIEKWMITKNTIEFLGIWEQLNNPDFNSYDFGGIRSDSGSNRFFISVKQWVEKTNAIGIMARSGKYGGTYAHKDIAFHFGMYISPMFNLLLIKEFQRLKDEESKTKNIEWDYRRFLCKVNYRIQTDSIKDHIIPKYTYLTKEQESWIYADSAEMDNMAVFGETSKEWRKKNPQEVLRGNNIRDLATIPQLTVLANIESYHGKLIQEGLPAKERLTKLKEFATAQLKTLSTYQYNFPIESPNTINNTDSTFDNTLKAVLSVPAPDKKK